MNRRHFLTRTAALATIAPALSLRAESEETFFTLAQRKGRWWFVTPEGKPFFSIALNQIDPAPTRLLTPPLSPPSLPPTARRRNG